MILRNFQKNDLKEVKTIIALYFSDQEFQKELSDKLLSYINQNEESISNKYKFFVAEENNEIVGIGGFRSAQNYLKPYAKTNNPSEFYILAVKYKNRGIGKALKQKRIEDAKVLGFTEILFYSPNSHKESWNFHDKLGFERIEEIIAPDGEPGQVWRKIL